MNVLQPKCAGCIRARLGVPEPMLDLYVTALVVDITAEPLVALMGRLGRVPGVTVESMIVNKTQGGSRGGVQ